jgi:hypothetical protein
MDLKLEDDVAVVLGGARGLGLAIAEAFASEAASVVLVDRDPEVTQAAARVSRSREAFGLVADGTNSSQIESAARRVREQMGRVKHVLVFLHESECPLCFLSPLLPGVTRRGAAGRGGHRDGSSRRVQATRVRRRSQ